MRWRRCSSGSPTRGSAPHAPRSSSTAVAPAASFRHATWGPDELFYGELYSSRRVPCRPTLARPGTRDEYSACVGRELVAEDLYDLLLFSLPDNDYHSHKNGPEAQLGSIARADDAFGELVDAT